MRRLRLTLEYDGTHFQGWQLQPDVRSVQGELEAAIACVTQERRRVYAAGRTDAGVHARGQVVHFDSGSCLEPNELRRALNAELPEDVAVRAAVRTAPDFDARRDVLRKRYVYRILNCATPSPLRARYTWHVRGSLDLEAMREAVDGLKGAHDFAAFRGAPGGAPAREDTRRTLDRLELRVRGAELWVLAEARSFLRYMVRNLVGTLVAVASGRFRPERIPALLASRQRAEAGPTAPPHGLCLDEIRYET